MTLDLLALGLLLAFAGIGALRGALASGLGVANLVVSYALSIVLAAPLAPAFGGRLGLSPVLAVPVASVAVFVTAFALGAALSAVALSAERRRRENASRTAGDRALGAAFGAARGALVVLLVGLLSIWLSAARTLGGAAPSPGESAVGGATRALVERGADALLAPDASGGRLLVRAAVRPEETLSGVRSLLEDPRITALRDDQEFWRLVEDGDVEHATRRAAFAGIAFHAETREKLAALGVVDARAAADPVAFTETAQAALLAAGPRIRALKTDPELQRLAADPALAEMAQRGDTIGLLQHPALRTVLERVLSDAAAEPAPADASATH